MKRQKGMGKRLLALLLAALLVLSGCGGSGDPQVPSDSGQSGSQTSSQPVSDGATGNGSQTNDNDADNAGEASPADPVDTSDMFSNRDYKTEYDENKSGHIQLNGSSIKTDADGVQIDGTTVTITGEGTYILSGTLDNGQIVVKAGNQDKLQLVFDGVSIHSETSAPLYILEGDKVFITLAQGTQNKLSNGGSFVAVDENNIDGALFSKQDLTINGSGSLTVDSPVGHGIVCKDDLVFTGGTITVNSSGHGLDVNDSVRIDGASLTVSAGKDGIHVENNDDTTKGFVYIADGVLDIVGEGDGISAGAYMQIDDGQFTLLTGGGSENGQKQTSDAWGGFMGGGRGGKGGPGGDQGGNPGGIGGDTSSSTSDSSTSIKGLKAAGDLIINGGTFTIDSADDAIHSNMSVTVNGGTFTIATGDDGFHADDTLTITDGAIEITESYEGFEGLHILVSGGDSKMVTTDDGLNAAGGTDSSGFGGDRGGDGFGRGGGFGGPGGMGSSSSNGSIVISGGKIYAKASGDGIDANGTLEISGGEVIICGPTSGDTATLDYDISGVIKGGTFIGTGGSMMAQTFSDSTQGVFAVNVGNVSAGTEIILTDASGKVLISYTPELNFAVVILSSPEMVKGESYTITVGGQSGAFEAQ